MTDLTTCDLKCVGEFDMQQTHVYDSSSVSSKTDKNYNIAKFSDEYWWKDGHWLYDIRWIRRRSDWIEMEGWYLLEAVHTGIVQLQSQMAILVIQHVLIGEWQIRTDNFVHVSRMPNGQLSAVGDSGHVLYDGRRSRRVRESERVATYSGPSASGSAAWYPAKFTP